MDSEQLLLTEREACERLAVGRSTLRSLMAQGEISPVHIGRSIRFRSEELMEFVARLGETRGVAGRSG